MKNNPDYQKHKANIDKFNTCEEEKRRLRAELWLLYIGNVNTFDV